MENKRKDIIINSGYYPILGTDQFDDAEKSFGPEYKAYREKWNEYPERGIVNDFPLHIDIESTNACNLRCTMCPRNFMTEKIGYIEWDLFQKIIDEGARHRLPSIKLNYRGEPLLHPQLTEMVFYAKKKGIIEVQFNTNGLTLNEKKIEELIDSGLDRIIFSIDGATKKTYEMIRTGSNYERVANNVKTLVKMRNKKGSKRPLVRVQMVKMKENDHELQDFLRMWIPIANRVAVNTKWEPTGIQGEVEHFPCPQIWQRLMVCWDGEARMCCGDWQGEIVLGDVKESSIYELWHGEKLNKIRALHSEGRFNEMPVCLKCQENTPLADSEIQRVINSVVDGGCTTE